MPRELLRRDVVEAVQKTLAEGHTIGATAVKHDLSYDAVRLIYRGITVLCVPRTKKGRVEPSG